MNSSISGNVQVLQQAALVAFPKAKVTAEKAKKCKKMFNQKNILLMHHWSTVLSSKLSNRNTSLKRKLNRQGDCNPCDDLDQFFSELKATLRDSSAINPKSDMWKPTSKSGKKSLSQFVKLSVALSTKK